MSNLEDRVKNIPQFRAHNHHLFMQEPSVMYGIFPVMLIPILLPLPTVSFHSKNLCYVSIYACIHIKLHFFPCVYVFLTYVNGIFLWIVFYFFPLYSLQCPQGLFMTLSIHLVGSNCFSEYRHPCCVCGNSDLRQNIIVTVVNKLIHDLFWNYVNIPHDIPKSRLFRLENIHILHLAKYCQLAFLNGFTNLNFHQMLLDILPTS